jgi:hypothetical protein
MWALSMSLRAEADDSTGKRFFKILVFTFVVGAIVEPTKLTEFSIMYLILYPRLV